MARKLAGALGKGIMSLLRRRRRKSKRNPNPYASRGLEKFALVAAELAEKRQQLSLQLGAPVSVVRFAAGSHSKWIPIIVSPTKKKTIETKSSSLMISERRISTVRDSAIVADAAPSPMNSAVMQPQSATNGSELSQSAVTNGRDRGLSHVGNGGEAWQEVIAKTAAIVGTIAGIIWATKFSTTFGMTIATALASSALLLRSHAETAMAIERSISETPAAEEGRAESSASAAAVGIQRSKRPNETSRSIAQQSNVASPFTPNAESYLPKPPPVRISTALSKESSPRASDAAHHLSSPTTQRSRFKYKFLREGLHKKPETLSAPSTPRECTAHIPTTRSETGVFHIDKSSQKRELAEWSSFVRERERKEKAARIGTSLTAVGLVIVLGSLLLGQFAAIVGVICWWYLLPRLRKAVGDKPFVRSHNHNSSDKHHSTSTKKTITGAGNGKHDREYKKKVIMDGLLERDRTRPNA